MCCKNELANAYHLQQIHEREDKMKALHDYLVCMTMCLYIHKRVQQYGTIYKRAFHNQPTDEYIRGDA